MLISYVRSGTAGCLPSTTAYKVNNLEAITIHDIYGGPERTRNYVPVPFDGDAIRLDLERDDKVRDGGICLQGGKLPGLSVDMKLHTCTISKAAGKTARAARGHFVACTRTSTTAASRAGNL